MGQITLRFELTGKMSFAYYAMRSVPAICLGLTLFLNLTCQSWGKFWDVTPRIVSITPGEGDTNTAVCSGSPCSAKIVIVFSQTMNTNTSQILTTEFFDGSTYISASNAGSTMNWGTTSNNNDTFTINLSWYWFPENTRIRYTLAGSAFTGISGLTLEAPIQVTFTTTTSAAAFAVADSSQTACYNAAGSQACANASFPNQDGDLTNTPTARSHTGPTAHATYTSDYTTRDNVTGITWRSCSEGLSGATCATGTAATLNWINAVNQCAALNSANAGSGYAGITTWRLPTIVELESLQHGQNIGPSILTANFPATAASPYWTSHTTASAAGSAGWVHFNIPFVSSAGQSSLSKTSLYNVRCVASPTTISQRNLTDNGDGTITDTVTGLRWQKCSNGQNNDATCSGAAALITWQAALQYCDTLTLGSFANSANWRLPSTPELRSIFDRSRSNPAINTGTFPATMSASYWTSTSNPASGGNYWSTDFSNSSINDVGKAGTTYARCVATGP